MNVPALLSLAAYLRELPRERFNMAIGPRERSNSRGDCGCIACHAEDLFDPKACSLDSIMTETCDLPYEQIAALCYNWAVGGSQYDPVAAAIVVENLAATGTVDWSLVAKPYVPTEEELADVDA